MTSGVEDATDFSDFSDFSDSLDLLSLSLRLLVAGELAVMESASIGEGRSVPVGGETEEAGGEPESARLLLLLLLRAVPTW